MEDHTRPVESTLDEELIELRIWLVGRWLRKGNPRWKAEEAAQVGIQRAWLKADQYKAKTGWRGRVASRKTFLGTVALRAGLNYLSYEAKYEKLKKRASEEVEVYNKRLQPNRRKKQFLSELDGAGCS